MTRKRKGSYVRRTNQEPKETRGERAFRWREQRKQQRKQQEQSQEDEQPLQDQLADAQDRRTWAEETKRVLLLKMRYGQSRNRLICEKAMHWLLVVILANCIMIGVLISLGMILSVNGWLLLGICASLFIQHLLLWQVYNHIETLWRQCGGMMPLTGKPRGGRSRVLQIQARWGQELEQEEREEGESDATTFTE